MIQIGDKIMDKRFNTEHIVESIESLPTITVIFTEDMKCIPIQYIKKVIPIWVKLLNMVFFNKTLTFTEQSELKTFVESEVMFKNEITPDFCKKWVKTWKEKNL